jgi:uncharacterized protein
MAVIDGRTWMEHIPEDECWALLSTAPIGRIAVLVDSAPEIYPVNHAVDGRSVVFRSDAGTKLRGIDRSPSVSFEVDGVDDVSQEGWSVLVKGRAVELSSADEVHVASELPLRFWVAGDKSHWIRIIPTEVTGRRTVPPRRHQP